MAQPHRLLALSFSIGPTSRLIATWAKKPSSMCGSASTAISPPTTLEAGIPGHGQDHKSKACPGEHHTKNANRRQRPIWCKHGEDRKEALVKDDVASQVEHHHDRAHHQHHTWTPLCRARLAISARQWRPMPHKKHKAPSKPTCKPHMAACENSLAVLVARSLAPKRTASTTGQHQDPISAGMESSPTSTVALQRPLLPSELLLAEAASAAGAGPHSPPSQAGGGASHLPALPPLLQQPKRDTAPDAWATIRAPPAADTAARPK
eukprot:CAMPEP_0178431474 /NCGR_PEP_ID=MMETSP0689_2-20121128/31867_1 /TAXON_ID=160604 /ORGANISM="Amphidinium massartii, Strain CS-259" /LENGTH=263 /DNA_ID=CAMNT_0020053389 /DNA_START=150 /DNA_END=943 /DNA_ORIENTATION=+